VLAGGTGSADNFRRSPDGYAWPSKNFAGTSRRARVSATAVSFGGYIGDGHGWRPTPIPLTPVPGISVNGQDANGNPNPGPLLSQQTTGYYSALNQNVWAKDDYNRTWLLYARQNLRLDAITMLHNLTWYRQGNRLHKHSTTTSMAPATCTNTTIRTRKPMATSCGPRSRCPTTTSPWAAISSTASTTRAMLSTALWHRTSARIWCPTPSFAAITGT
jgi:hypothetical protein